MKKDHFFTTSYRGQTAVEYLIVFTIVAIVVFAGFHHFFPTLNKSTNSYFDKISVVIRDDYKTVPIDGGWCSWGSCGPDGYQRRECSCPQPAFGGAICPDTSEGTFKGASSVKGIRDCEAQRQFCTGTQVYDPLQNECVLCGNGVADPGETCVNCAQDLDCEGKDPCSSNLECEEARPYCSPMGTCGECNTNSDCGEARCFGNSYVKPVCTSDNECVTHTRAYGSGGCRPF